MIILSLCAMSGSFEIEEFEGDEEYMEAVGKLEELVMDPDFAGAYDKGAKKQIKIFIFEEFDHGSD